MKRVVFYCYDAYCGWCYGFSPVMKKIAAAYSDRLSFEVLSGGMIPAEYARPIAASAGYIREAYKTVEELTGIQFGEDYLWHIFHPDQSDWFMHSEKSAEALCIFKEIYPDHQVDFAADLQYALHYEGRDLTDDEAYRHLLEKWNIPADEFYAKLHNEEYKEKARYEFALCQQLRVSSFPAVLLQESESKFYLVAKGFTSYADVQTRLDAIIKTIAATDAS